MAPICPRCGCDQIQIMNADALECARCSWVGEADELDEGEVDDAPEASL
jgi:hypothetical protein